MTTYFELAGDEKCGKELPPKQKSFGLEDLCWAWAEKVQDCHPLIFGWSAILQFSLE